MSNKERRALEKELKQLKNQLRSLERKIDTQEKKIADVELILADPEAFKAAENKDVFHQHAEMQLKLEDYMHRWEKTGKAIDNLNVQLTVEN